MDCGNVIIVCTGVGVGWVGWVGLGWSVGMNDVLLDIHTGNH